MLLRCILLLFPLFFAKLKAQSFYYPPNQSNLWDTLSPASLAWCPEQIDSLYAFLEDQESKAFILLKDGKIVLERYFNGFQQSDSWYWVSAGKTLSAVLVGLAQEQGFLSIHDSSSQYLGSGWTSLTPAQEREITVWHQLTMTSGLDDGVPNQECTIDTCLQYLADPGQRWAYHNAPYTLLDSVVFYATGSNMNAWYQSTLRNPLGMDGAFLPLGDLNVFFSTARSMARFGLFLLSQGRWNGTQIMQDTAYFQAMVSPSQSLNASYGYLFWLNGQPSYMIPQVQFQFSGPMNPDAPADLFAGFGKNAQMLNVVPSQGLVMLRLGDAPPGETGPVSITFNNKVWQYINRLPCTTQAEQHPSSAEPFAWPNPMKDRLYLPWSHGKTRLFDLQGRLWLEALGQNPLDVGFLPSGVYVLEQEQNGTIFRQLVWK